MTDRCFPHWMEGRRVMQPSPQHSAAPRANIPAPTSRRPRSRFRRDPPVYVPVHALLQLTKAQQLFQKDAQTITPEILESVTAALASIEIGHNGETKKKAIPRIAAGQAEDVLAHKDLPENESCLFWSDLGKEVNDNELRKAFSRFPSSNMALAQQLFQRDMQTITPEALESLTALLASIEIEHEAETKKKARPRITADDYCLSCKNLGDEVNEDVLTKAFSRFPSFKMARVSRSRRTGKSMGFGCAFFSNRSDCAAALKKLNGKYIGRRPIKLRKVSW